MNEVHSIPINEIIVLPQPRKVFRNIDTLAAAISVHGLLQPITITPSKRLLYGERRYRACKSLGLGNINAIYSEELTDDQILERQIAENVEREELSWQERALALLDLFRLKRRRGALEGWAWGQREAAALFKMALGTVNYVLLVAQRLEKELALPEDQRKYHQFSSVSEAYRLGILQEEEDRLLELAAQKAKEAATATSEAAKRQVAELEISLSQDAPTVDPKAALLRLKAKSDGYLSLTKDEAKELYLSNPINPPEEFELYYKEKTEALEELVTIDLSQTLVNDDCIDFMNRCGGAFDHIITDPPYAIDMDMLAQQNQGMSIAEHIDKAHDVDENVNLLNNFFRAAFFCTKEGAFVLVFCDTMMFTRLHALATEAGFAAQRWPLVWRKINQPLMNNANSYNTTKDYELVLVARKPKSVLVKPRNSSIFEASSVEAKKLTDHPFAKPLDLVKDLVEMVSTEGQTILEPFAGGGSIVLSILGCNRKVIAVEKNQQQYDKLCENIKREHYLRLNPRFRFV